MTPLCRAPASVLRLTLAAVNTVLVTVLLLQPSGQPLIGPPAPPGPPSLHREIMLVFGHFVVFVLLAVLWWWAYRGYRSATGALRLVVVSCIAFGVLSELAQTFSRDRSASFVDVSVNSATVLLVAWVISAYSSRR